MSFVNGLKCLNCKSQIDVEPFRYQCPHCGGYLEVLFDYPQMQAKTTGTSWMYVEGPSWNNGSNSCPLKIRA